ncbi:hypothetical protein Ahu01nite_099940 [Winogradskya humida]|uniref:Uncharacterized protein n=2 Tax=Micromonosporaceae TaxID=28056 RepID=A0ABQ4A7P5_9ACTN|nr:hypothetical protein Ahu01nite_099940 [Actinoplanes humidus]
MVRFLLARAPGRLHMCDRDVSWRVRARPKPFRHAIAGASIGSRSETPKRKRELAAFTGVIEMSKVALSRSKTVAIVSALIAALVFSGAQAPVNPQVKPVVSATGEGEVWCC